MESPVYEWLQPSAEPVSKLPTVNAMSQDLGAVRVSWGGERAVDWPGVYTVQEQLSSKSHLVSNLIPSTVYTLHHAVYTEQLCLPCVVSHLVLQPLIWWDHKLQSTSLFTVSAEGCDHL